MRRLRQVVRIEGGSIGLDILVERRKPLGKLLAGGDARLAGVAIEKRTVNGHTFPAHQAEIAQYQHELPTHRPERRPVLPAEIADRPIARPKPFEQPDQLKIAPGFALKSARGADPVQVSVNVQLEQVPRMIGRLPSSAAGAGMPKPSLSNIDRAPVSINRPHRIITPDIVLDPGRKEVRLLPTDTQLEAVAIRHQRIVHATQKYAMKSCPVSQRHPGPPPPHFAALNAGYRFKPPRASPSSGGGRRVAQAVAVSYA